MTEAEWLEAAKEGKGGKVSSRLALLELVWGGESAEEELELDEEEERGQRGGGEQRANREPSTEGSASMR